eukprot:c5575_g1_i1 orf=1-153(-)
MFPLASLNWPYFTNPRDDKHIATMNLHVNKGKFRFSCNLNGFFFLAADLQG